MNDAQHNSAATSDWRVDWGRLLRTARQVAGLSLTDLSRATGLSKGYLSKLESGHVNAANPSRTTLAALARALPSFGPLAHTLEPAGPIGALAFSQVAPRPPEVVLDATGAPRANPVALGWRELELVMALLIAEQTATTQPITALLLARAVGRSTADVRATLDRMVDMGIVTVHPPRLPGGQPTYRRSGDFEARVGITRVGDALILAAALLAQAPSARRQRPSPEDDDDE